MSHAIRKLSITATNARIAALNARRLNHLAAKSACDAGGLLPHASDWSDYNYIVGNPVKREDGFVRLLTEYDQVLLQFGMHISWKR